jgi:hypothetical protein
VPKSRQRAFSDMPVINVQPGDLDVRPPTIEELYYPDSKSELYDNTFLDRLFNYTDSSMIAHPCLQSSDSSSSAVKLLYETRIPAPKPTRELRRAIHKRLSPAKHLTWISNKIPILHHHQSSPVNWSFLLLSWKSLS